VGSYAEQLANAIFKAKNEIDSLSDAIQKKDYVKVKDPSPWMTTYWNELKGMSFKELVIAGSHDSGCYNMM
jgi:hypothetical protein